MNNKDSMTLVLYSRTYGSDSDDNITILTMPKEFAKELDIENCKVSMSILRDFRGHKHLLISKYHREIMVDEYRLQ
jgi:hypothetical protein